MSTQTVLIIEDDEVLLTVIAELLRFEGLDVLIARDAHTGVQVAVEAHPDLILCDINLTQGSGYMVFESLQTDSRTNTIPMLFMTAAHNFDEIQQKTSIVREKIVRKPFDVSEFLAVIQRWL